MCIYVLMFHQGGDGSNFMCVLARAKLTISVCFTRGKDNYIYVCDIFWNTCHVYVCWLFIARRERRNLNIYVHICVLQTQSFMPTCVFLYFCVFATHIYTNTIHSTKQQNTRKQPHDKQQSNKDTNTSKGTGTTHVVVPNSRRTSILSS